MANNSDLKLNLLLKATDGMSNVIKKACTQSDAAFAKMNKSLEQTAGKFDEVGQKAALFGGALVAASGVNLKTAGDFEKGMNNIATVIDTNVESLDSMNKEILAMAKNSPMAISDLTDGLYDIRSAGISAELQFKTLKGAEMLAVTGLSTTAEAVDVATSAINAFGLKGEEASKMFDTMFKAVNYGKMSVSDFAQGFGSVAPIVAANKIAFDEYTASVAAMTTIGTKASIAHTQIKAAIAGLSRGSKEQIAIFNKLGAKSFDDLIKKSGGMVNTFEKINNAVNGNKTELIHLLGSVEAYSAVLALTGATNEVYNQTLNDMRRGGDFISEAYQKQMNGLNNQMASLKNNLQVLSIKFGTALLPAVKMAGEGIKSVTNLIDKMPDGLTSFLSIATAGIGVVSLFGGTSLMFIGSMIRNFILLRNVMRTASIFAWANPAILPITLVGGAIAVLAAGTVYCYNKFEGFRNMCQGTWSVLKAGGAWLAVLWQSFATGAMKVWDFISPAVKFAGVIFSWTTPIGLVIRGITSLTKWIGSLIEKVGGFRAIGENAKNFWENSTMDAEKLNAEIKRNRAVKKASANGSHANGLSYVPYDGYIAETHKGEAILTEDEANIWRSGTSINNNSQNSAITINFNPTVSIQNANSETKEEFLSLLRKYKNEIEEMIVGIQTRRIARAY